MKTHIIKKSSIALALIMMLASCNDLFNENDIKNNPNSPVPTQVGIPQLTTYALVGLSVLTEDTDTRIAAIWGGQLAGASRQHQTFQIYNVSSGTFGWSNYYNTAVNLRNLQKQSISKAQVGLGQVGEALLFAKMAGLYGDVPYTEAADLVNFPTPKFDGQAALYAKLITLLDAAVANLNAGGGIQGDFIYGNDAGLWKRAAKTLQARLYLHLKNYPAAVSAAQAGLASNAEDMLIPHGTSQQVDQNLNYDFFVNSRPGDTAFDPTQGSYLPKFMCTNIATGISAPLGTAIRNSKTNESNTFAAFFKKGAVQAGVWDANVKNGVFQKDSKSPIITYYESQLILAEALARQSSIVSVQAVTAVNNVRRGLASGKIFGTNYTLVRGDTLSAPGVTPVVYDSLYKYYTVADFTAGGAANPLASAKPSQTALLTEIAAQKFSILLMQYETFTELRRLSSLTPTVNLGIPINSGSKFPARYIYPQNEINTNPNVPKPTPDQFAKLPIF